MTICKSNSLAVDASAIGLQVMINFLFLIFFLFLYGPVIAKYSFKKDMNLIVDNVTDDLTDDDIKALIGGQSASVATTRIDTAIDTMKVSDATNSAEKAALEKNNKSVLGDAFKNYAIVSGIIIVILIGILLFNYCLDFKHGLKLAFITTIFIAITEFMLVNVTKNYVGVSIPKAKGVIGNTIKKWIATNKPK